MPDDPRHSWKRRRLDDEGPSREMRAVLGSEMAKIALVRAVAELYCDELLERAGYRPGVDDPDQLLNEITLEADCRELRHRPDEEVAEGKIELWVVIDHGDDDARDDDDPREVLGSDRV